MFDDQFVEKFAKAARGGFQNTLDDRAEEADKGTREAGVDGLNLDALDQNELIMLRAQIEQRMDNPRLREIDLEREFLVQLSAARRLQRDLVSTQANPNQIAATMNAITTVLRDITKLRVQLHTAEKLRKIEQLLVRQLQKLPADLAEDFLAEYEAVYAAIEAEKRD